MPERCGESHAPLPVLALWRRIGETARTTSCPLLFCCHTGRCCQPQNRGTAQRNEQDYRGRLAGMCVSGSPGTAHCCCWHVSNVQRRKKAGRDLEGNHTVAWSSSVNLYELFAVQWIRLRRLGLRHCSSFLSAQLCSLRRAGNGPELPGW
ncbi:unnamed protein product [Pleuronectes platessa]|uniref:Uncharacterized protein n=1 Tax=Pleuronectes platessa TaxID=8262 RepID=A0A9N7VIG5_PLEPL|nr:unnamed protein product [Pleuronectes platessa]